MSSPPSSTHEEAQPQHQPQQDEDKSSKEHQANGEGHEEESSQLKTSLYFDTEVVDLAHHPHANMGVEYKFGPNVIDLDLTHCGLKKIENIQHLTQLRILRLRQNLLTSIEEHGTGLECCSELEHLDLYDNQLKTSTISVELFNRHLTKLNLLDLSFNQLRHCLIGLDLPQLEELYYVNNKIKKIDAGAFDHLPRLTMLELGSNRIREIENLEPLVQLEQLWLGTNKITQIKNLDHFVNLQKLSIQCNRLVKMEGLSHLINLTELYLSENGIERIEGLENLVNLKVLDVAVNRLRKFENIEHLQQLEEFWANDNLIESFEELSILAKLPVLDAVFLQRNKIESDPQYKRKVVLMLPQITQLDGFPLMRNNLLLNQNK